MLAGHPGGRCPIGMQPAIVVGSTAQVTGIHIIDKHITKTTNASPGVIGFGRFVLSVSVDIKSRENSAVMTSMGTTGLSSNFCYCCLGADAHSKRQPTELHSRRHHGRHTVLAAHFKSPSCQVGLAIGHPRTTHRLAPDVPKSTWSTAQSTDLLQCNRTPAHSPLQASGFLVQSPLVQP